MAAAMTSAHAPSRLPAMANASPPLSSNTALVAGTISGTAAGIHSTGSFSGAAATLTQGGTPVETYGTASFSGAGNISAGGTISIGGGNLSTEPASGPLSNFNIATVSIHPRGQQVSPYAVAAFDAVMASTLASFFNLPATAASSLTPTGTVFRPWRPVAPVQAQPTYPAFARIVREESTAEKIFGAIQALYLSSNRPRDRQIADRITALHRDAIAEGQHIYPASLNQFTHFFLTNNDPGFPRITLTPDETLRVRWIQGQGNFVAIEFTGEPNAKLVAELPGLDPPIHFSRQPIANVLAVARAMGASFK